MHKAYTLTDTHTHTQHIGGRHVGNSEKDQLREGPIRRDNEVAKEERGKKRGEGGKNQVEGWREEGWGFVGAKALSEDPPARDFLLY